MAASRLEPSLCVVLPLPEARPGADRPPSSRSDGTNLAIIRLVPMRVASSPTMLILAGCLTRPLLPLSPPSDTPPPRRVPRATSHPVPLLMRIATPFPVPVGSGAARVLYPPHVHYPIRAALSGTAGAESRERSSPPPRPTSPANARVRPGEVPVRASRERRRPYSAGLSWLA